MFAQTLKAWIAFTLTACTIALAYTAVRHFPPAPPKEPQASVINIGLSDVKHFKPSDATLLRVLVHGYSLEFDPELPSESPLLELELFASPSMERTGKARVDHMLKLEQEDMVDLRQSAAVSIENVFLSEDKTQLVIEISQWHLTGAGSTLYRCTNTLNPALTAPTLCITL